MAPISRKHFIQQSTLAAAGILVAGCRLPAAHSRLSTPYSRLSFSTLGCPDWTLEEVVRVAKAEGYSGIEVRGLRRCMHLPDCPEFATPAARAATMEAMGGLRFVNLGASAALHLEGADREKALAEARAFIDLAAQINCPYVRVFPNNYPKGSDKAAVHARITDGLRTLGRYASGKGVTVLMETHGDVVSIADVKSIMSAVGEKSVGLVWDPANMWVVTGEAPAAAFRELRPWIQHVHLKDARVVEGKPAYTLMGEGQVPAAEAVRALREGGYGGYYSFEWEKLWHPGLPEPAVAFAQYPQWIKKLL